MQQRNLNTYITQLKALKTVITNNEKELLILPENSLFKQLEQPSWYFPVTDSSDPEIVTSVINAQFKFIAKLLDLSDAANRLLNNPQEDFLRGRGIDMSKSQSLRLLSMNIETYSKSLKDTVQVLAMQERLNKAITWMNPHLPNPVINVPAEASPTPVQTPVQRPTIAREPLLPNSITNPVIPVSVVANEEENSIFRSRNMFIAALVTIPVGIALMALVGTVGIVIGSVLLAFGTTCALVAGGMAYTETSNDEPNNFGNSWSSMSGNLGGSSSVDDSAQVHINHQLAADQAMQMHLFAHDQAVQMHQTAQDQAAQTHQMAVDNTMHSNNFSMGF